MIVASPSASSSPRGKERKRTKLLSKSFGGAGLRGGKGKGGERGGRNELIEPCLSEPATPEAKRRGEEKGTRKGSLATCHPVTFDSGRAQRRKERRRKKKGGRECNDGSLLRFPFTVAEKRKKKRGLKKDDLRFDRIAPKGEKGGKRKREGRPAAARVRPYLAEAMEKKQKGRGLEGGITEGEKKKGERGGQQQTLDIISMPSLGAHQGFEKKKITFIELNYCQSTGPIKKKRRERKGEKKGIISL